MALRDDLGAMTSSSSYPMGIGAQNPLPPIPLHVPFGGGVYHAPPPRPRRQHDSSRLSSSYHQASQDIAALEELQKRRNLEKIALARISRSASGPSRDRQLMDRLRDRIYACYVGYLGWVQEQLGKGRDEESCLGEGKQKRHQLQELVTEFVCQVMQKDKYQLGMSFELLLRETIERKGKSFDPLRSAEAFRCLERYACNLLVQPWREEFRRIKLYGGYFKHKIERYLSQPAAVLELLGYVRHSNCMVLPTKPLDPDDMMAVALDCLIANVECRILHQLRTGVKSYDCRWIDLYNMRCQLQGATIPECIRLIHHSEQKLQSREMENMYKEMESLGYGGRVREREKEFLKGTNPLQRKPVRLKPVHVNGSGSVDEVDRRYRSDSGSHVDEYQMRRDMPGSAPSYMKSRPQLSHRESQTNLISPSPTPQSSRDKSTGRGSYKLPAPSSIDGLSVNSCPPYTMPKLGPSPTPPPENNNASMMMSEDPYSAERIEKKIERFNQQEHPRSSRLRDIHLNISAQSSESLSPEDSGWSCTFCTFLNEPKANICVMCSKSKMLREEAIAPKNMVSGGRECPSCTLINSKAAKYCEACEASLLNSPTYI